MKPGADELCARFVSTPDEGQAAAALEVLFSEWLMPWSVDAVRRNLACYGLRNADRSDIEKETDAEVLLALTTRLRAVRAGAAEPVQNIRAYLSATAQNACFARIRARCPKHVQLQNRIRYLLRNDNRFATWTTETGEQLAGRKEWQDRADFLPCPEAPGPEVTLDVALTRVFRDAEGPVRVLDLIRTLAQALKLTEAGGAHVEPDSLATRERTADARLLDREKLAALWEEVRELPAQQRSALLLNLRDSDGQGVIELLPASGVASFAELASMLELSPTELAELWPGLPMDDAAIATKLGLTRQQVINLRKSARARLGRRMARNAAGNTGTLSSSGESGGMLARAGRTIRAILRRKGQQ